MQKIGASRDNLLKPALAVALFFIASVAFGILCRTYIFAYVLAAIFVAMGGYPIHWATKPGPYRAYWVALVLSVLAGGILGFCDEILGYRNPLSGLEQR